jgi:hypothetical protein
LFDDVGGFERVVALVVAFFVELFDCFCDAKGFSVKRRLGNQAIGKRKPKNTCNTCCGAKEENVPMETGRFPEREFTSLGDKGRYWKKLLAG